MPAIRPSSKHYMQFRHFNAGVGDTSWTKKLIKDGELQTAIGVEVVNVDSSQVYSAQFTDDGTDRATWTLLVYETADDSVTYNESWYVTNDTVQEIAEFLRAEIIQLRDDIRRYDQLLERLFRDIQAGFNLVINAIRNIRNG